MRQADLPNRRGGLAFLKPERAVRKLECAAPERDRPGGDEDHLLAARAQAHEILEQSVKPGAIDAAGLRIHQQRRAHLDNDAPGGAQGRRHRKTIRNRHFNRDFVRSPSAGPSLPSPDASP